MNQLPLRRLLAAAVVCAAAIAGAAAMAGAAPVSLSTTASPAAQVSGQATILATGQVPGQATSQATGQVAGQVPPQSPPVVIESPDRVQPVPADDDAVFRGRLHIHRPIVRVAQNYTVPAGETVREVQVILGDLRIDGHVDQDVVVILGSVRVSSTAEIGGTLAVFGGSATVESGARVRHDLIVTGGALSAPEDFTPSGYQVVIGSPWLGAMLNDIAPWLTRGLLWGRLIVPDIGWVWLAVGLFFLVYLTLNVVFDRAVADSASLVAHRPLSVFMAGFLVMLLSVPALALIAATVIGLVLVPFIVCALIVLALIGKTSVARAVGRSVLRTDSGRVSAAVAFTLGFALLTLAYMVPVLGFVTWALTTVMGFGAAAMTFRRLLRRERPAAAAAAPGAAAPGATAPGAPVTAAALAAPPASPMPSTAPSPSAFDVPEPAAPFVPVIPPAPQPRAEARSPYSAGLAQYPRATFLDRVAAFALDAILVAIASAILDFDRHEGTFFLLLLGYHIAFWAWKGTTLGGIVCNLRVIRTDGSDLRGADAVVRGLGSIFSMASLGIGCFWMLQDPERQMWHDKIAGTLVVKVPRELALA